MAEAAARRATLVGSLAILLWATLTALIAASGPIPPFELLALTFSVAAASGLASWTLRPAAAAALRQPPRIWLLGVAGLFGYHAVFFAALQHAPPAEASLINYLWPLLVVLLSGLLPGERLMARHLVGAGLGFAGVAVLVLGRGGLRPDPHALGGYGLALVSAGIWAGYSVLSRRVAAVPTDTVVGFCLATALLAWPCHFAWEPTVWPAGPLQWGAVLALGLGPVGVAFSCWDRGVKHGDIRLLGVASYATPILSTLLLVAIGLAPPSPALALACLMIVGGALVASWDQVRDQANALKVLATRS